MTTRSRQQLSSILAVFSIIALLILLVFVWTAGRNGVFSNGNDDIKAHGSYRLRTFSQSDSTVPSTAIIDDQQPTEHGHHHHHHHRHNESTTLHGKSFDLLLFSSNRRRIPCYSHSQNRFVRNVCSSFQFRSIRLVVCLVKKEAIEMMRHLLDWYCGFRMIRSAYALHMAVVLYIVYWNRMRNCKKNMNFALFSI